MCFCQYVIIDMLVAGYFVFNSVPFNVESRLTWKQWCMNTQCEWNILRILVWFGRGNDWCTQSPDYFFDWRSVAGLCIRLYTWLLLTLLYTSLSVSLSFTGIGFFTYMRASMHTNIYIYIHLHVVFLSMVIIFEKWYQLLPLTPLYRLVSARKA